MADSYYAWLCNMNDSHVYVGAFVQSNFGFHRWGIVLPGQILCQVFWIASSSF